MELNPFIDALKSGEDFMLRRLYIYASDSEYTRYTSTKEKDWRMTLKEPARVLIEYLQNNDKPDSIHVDEKFDENPAAAFGVIEAKRHRERGVRFDMFLGLAKLVRQAFIDLVYETELTDEERKQTLAGTHRFFDKFELGFCAEWVRHQQTDLISELKHAQENLELFRDLIDQSNDAIYVIDPKSSRILDVNEKACSSLKYTREELLNMNVVDIEAVIPDHFSWETHANEVRKMTSMLLEKKHKRKDGSSFPVEINVKFVRCGEKEYMVAGVRDLTERKKFEARLQQAQKMEAIGTLAGGIAHDFNNILFPIVGFAEMALEDTPEDSQLRISVNEILKGAKRAGDLVKQILTFGRKANNELKPLKIQLVIKEVLKLIRSSLPSTINIKQYIRNDCGFIMADPTQIHQIAMNLLTNAYHAMQDEGGRLEVTLKEVELGIDDLIDQSMIPGPYVCLTVADTGVGMNKAVMDRIFDPYFTTKEKDKGTGLGLAMVHGIVKSYKGDIRVYSEPGEGTAFHVYLPMIKTQAETEKTENLASVRRGTERILLIDDEESIIRMETQMLERLGYHVTPRASSVDALEAFQAAPDKFDLVITDTTMPNMTGVQLSQKLLEIRADTKIIICTGFSEQINEETAKLMGINGFVMKPVIKSELAKKIREVLDPD